MRRSPDGGVPLGWRRFTSVSAVDQHRGRRQGPWRSLEAVEFATLAWVDWFNTRRLLEPIGYVPPTEYEARYYQQAAVA